MNKDGVGKTLVQCYGNIVEHLTTADPRVQNVLVASAEPGEGRTMTAIGLAVASALLKPEERVLLVDLDLRHPVLHRRIGLDGSVGVKEVVANRLSIKEVLRRTRLDNLAVIAGGADPVDFSEVFQSEPMSNFLGEVKAQYDMAFYDSSAINSYADSHALSSLMDGVILVVRSDRSKRDEVIAARNKIDSANGKVIGAIVNDFQNPIISFLDGLF